MQRPATTRPAPSTRLLAACLAAWLLAGPVVGVLHLVLIPHHLCDQHRVVEHDAADHGAPLEEAPGEHDEHDSCSLVLIAAPAAPAPEHSDEHWERACTGVHAPVQQARLASAIACYRLAPKTSPPRSA